jgi:hypothetical protein
MKPLRALSAASIVSRDVRSSLSSSDRAALFSRMAAMERAVDPSSPLVLMSKIPTKAEPRKYSTAGPRDSAIAKARGVADTRTVESDMLTSTGKVVLRRCTSIASSPPLQFFCWCEEMNQRRAATDPLL